jgi:5-methylcytosine-specific restriction endonuclease McrA
MKTLLLDKIYQPITFLSFRRMVKLVFTGKVDVISEWDASLTRDKKYPAVLRLKRYIRKRPRVPRFNRRNVFRRDMYRCQYTGEILPPAQLTVDHVLPRAQGGKSSWENCVTCSLKANAEKDDRTPEQAGMKLLNKPTAPAHLLTLEFILYKDPHPDWAVYFPQVRDIKRDEYEQMSSSL